MESEIKTFIAVWISATASLTYCYYISLLVPKGKTRLLTLLPIFLMLTLLPLNLTTISLGGSTAFFLTWLTNFKLLLFSFGHGPLSSHPSISLPRFIFIASLPIQIINPQIPTKTTPKSPLNLTIKTILFLLLIILYQHIHPKLTLTYYCCCIYLGLELMLAMVAATAAALLGLTLEPQFDEPYLASSLQDFWGRRWNLMVSNIMRPTVYEPIKKQLASKRSLGRLIAVLCTFLASGLMHELIFFYLGRARPTWEVTCFFVLHGVCLAAEVAAKAAVERRRLRWRVHRAVSGPVAVAFVMVSGFWLFFPQLLRFSADARISEEFGAFAGFVKQSVFSSIGGVSSLVGKGVFSAQP